MHIIYVYDYNNGGLADMIKYFLVAIHIANIFNLELYIDIKHPINKFLIIEDKYLCKFNYDNYEFLSEEKNLKFMINEKKNFIYNTLSFFNKSINQSEIPNISYLFNKYNFFDYINFSQEIYNSVNDIVSKNKCNYISIHLRCGDKYISHGKDFFNDDRLRIKNFYNEVKKIIDKNNKNNKIYFFCDNNEIKNDYKNKFQELNLLFNEPILHVSYNNNDIFNNDIILETFKHTLVEFVFIHMSNEIHSLTYSGFSLIAHLLRKKQNKFIKYYKMK